MHRSLVVLDLTDWKVWALIKSLTSEPGVVICEQSIQLDNDNSLRWVPTRSFTTRSAPGHAIMTISPLCTQSTLLWRVFMHSFTLHAIMTGPSAVHTRMTRRAHYYDGSQCTQCTSSWRVPVNPVKCPSAPSSGHYEKPQCTLLWRVRVHTVRMGPSTPSAWFYEGSYSAQYYNYY